MHAWRQIGSQIIEARDEHAQTCMDSFTDRRPGCHGRTILVRNVWSDITADSGRFEQAFSDDGGKTWEVNWIAVDTRLKE
jgi:hypothetical protein